MSWPIGITRTDHTLACRAVARRRGTALGSTGVTIAVTGLTISHDERRIPQTQAVVTGVAEDRALLAQLGPHNGGGELDLYAAYNGIEEHYATLTIRRRVLNLPDDTVVVELASPDADWTNEQRAQKVEAP